MQIKVTFPIPLSGSLGVWQACHVFGVNGGDSPHPLRTSCSLRAQQCLADSPLQPGGITAGFGADEYFPLLKEK